MLTSIIINNYNYAEFLEDAINSALEQDSATIEIIVVDDGSTDDSKRIIESYGNRIISVFKENGGQASAFNTGYAASTGDIICFLDADDYFYAQKITQISQIFDQYPEAGWCFHELEEVNSHGSPYYRERRCIDQFEFIALSHILIEGKTFQHRFPATSGLCLKRHLLDAIFPMPEAFKIAADSYVRLAAIYLSPGVLSPDRYAVHRQHSNNLYDFRKDIHINKARVSLKSAYYLRQRFPAVQAYTHQWACNTVNKLVNTIGLKQTLLKAEIGTYLWKEKSGGLNLRIAIALAKTYVRKGMRWVKGMQWAKEMHSPMALRQSLSKQHRSSQAISIHPAPIFLLGYPKSGTTAIAMLLSKLSRESITSDLFYKIDPQKEQQLPKQLFNEVIEFSDFVADNQRYFSTRLNKSPLFSFLYPQLKQHFPAAQFVFILRDPRDTLRSYLNRRGLPGHLETLSPEQQNHLNRFMTIPPTTGHYIDRLANRWAIAANTYLTHPSEMTLVRYEDFMANKLGVIRSLAQELGLPEQADIVSDLETQYQPQGDRHISWHDFFGAHNLSRIENICAEPMRLLKYPRSK